MKLLLLATAFAACVLPYATAGRFVCYFPNWAFGRQEPWQFGVENVDTNLCTHLVYAFADLDETTFQIKPNNPAVDIDQEFYRKFTDLKNQNPNLKTMLAIGGWVDSNINDKYSQLVASSENIDVFVGSVITLLQEYGFDGLDMDWEYPRSEADKTGFTNLLVALKDAFAPFNYILSAAVPAIAADLGYDIPAIETTVDFINLMTYDMHGSWEPDMADHHAPLRKRSFETTDNNVEYSVDYWIANGISASKINLGMPLYGRSWKLASAMTTPPAPAVGVGAPGPITNEEGFVGYFEICQAVQNEGWEVVQDPDQYIGPYATSPTDVVNWIGYDDLAMLTTKSNYVMSKGLGGAMVWEISLDDYRGACGAGVNPLLTVGLSGMDALPFVDLIEADQIDLLLISHFHLDHCGALPWFLQKTTFKGRCFMTHATKAIYRWLLSDYIKVSNISTDQMLYTEADLEASMEKIEVINFHEEKDVGGVRFWAYNAGHVLGAAMFMIEIAGVKVLYTGDFSRQEDRHLMAAEIPTVRPDILITESTYGTHIHEKREDRESRFTGLIHEIVTRGGRCLIPVFALGRAQELLLILDEYWSLHPELHEIPIYYASSLAQKCMAVYQTYINAMNEKIRRQIAINNPFIFKHISSLKGIDQFEDVGPCVIMASPGMMQSGLSRELFEAWCTDPKNGCIIAGYCVEGTLAKHVLSEPEDITSMAGQKLPMKLSVDYISFSAHTDYQQTSEFIRLLKPPHVVLVHGEANEMNRLKAALIREYEHDPDTQIRIYNPRNTAAVELHFKGEKTAKVMGSLAFEKPVEGQIISGVLVKRNFKYQIVAPSDISKYTDMTVSSVTQRMGIHYSGNLQTLQAVLSHVSSDVEVIHNEKGLKSFRLFSVIDVIVDKSLVTLEWAADSVNDMFADAVLSAILKCESLQGSKAIVLPTTVDHGRFKECLIEMLQDMFGDEAVPKVFKGDKFIVTVDGKRANIDLTALEVDCPDDVGFQQVVQTAVLKLYQSLAPKTDKL